MEQLETGVDEARAPCVVTRSKMQNGGYRLSFSMGDEYGDIFVHELFTGVRFSAGDFFMGTVPLMTQPKKYGLTIMACSEGRCRIDVNEGHSAFLEPGRIAVHLDDTRTPLSMPTGRFLGIKFFIDFDTISNRLPRFLQDLDIDPFELEDRLCPNGEAFLASAPADLQAAMNHAVLHRNAPRADRRLLFAQCLNAVAAMEPDDNIARRIWLTPSQMMMAQGAIESMVSDLRKRTPVAEVAAGYGISESSLRSYFYSMYGESIPMYMKRRRMDEAAVLLATTNMTVGEIAIGVGYENQSKFASAFKSLKKMTPLEYRRMSRVDGFTASCY